MLALTLALSLSIAGVSAGQHASNHRNNRRSHHRSIQRAQVCDEGAWQCDGTQLQRCISSQWNTIEDCTGENMVCSVDGSTGCVWTWDISTVASPTSISTSTSAEPSSSQSVIGDALAAGNRPGHSWYTQSRNEWDSSSATEVAGSVSASTSTASSSATSSTVSAAASGDWSQSAAADLSTLTSASSTDEWNQPSAALSTGWGSESVVVSNTRSRTSASTSASSSVPVPTSGGGGGGGGSVNWNAPHHVIYSDYWLHTMPPAALLTDFNRFILAFWMSERGAVDNAQMWEWMSAAERQKIIDDYHAAGIALMVSAFGSTDAPTGVDPTDCAQRLAAWVKRYDLDGVDIDWEDMHAMNSGRGEAWLITFQQELRRLLPSGQYLISHAPVAPWFTSGSSYPGGAYVAVHEQAGDGIDFYNVQYYNQGNIYMDCETLIFESGSSWPSTSVFEMNTHAGVPLEKIVIGKPISAGAATNGYMTPSELSSCVKQAQDKGWNGGVMYWEWNSDTPSIMAVTLAQA